ncbi:sodium:proton antiporter [Oscillatoria sp. FACHB-1407]|uniref:cation:proton antiporter n=1 Tax=Oscillatoria sp. FACHB-1407 TaxID=2692847 RepID=UPI00168691A2|nr:sodium:proton antiporter [Oscillatoria sp. FACHB-1407]MBD2460924.1 sodium:proton antiporter [Oscillatoria sp. FACHB-1407]
MPVSIYILDLLVIGLLLLVITLGSGWIARLPLSYALIYLIVGVILGPYGVNLIQVKPDTGFVERLTEFVVLISLYSCGLKMNRPLRIWIWDSTVRLIGFLMPFSILATAFVGHWLLGLNWGAAILLGAILAPTDPVLASEVQLVHADDRDELRFGLTSEGGLNDALAFPFVYFGLYWLEDQNLDNWFRNWVAIDLIWGIAAGIGVGYAVAKGITWLSHRIPKKVPTIEEGMEDFLALATILLSYSLTEIVNGYGFLAVFVTGLTIRRKSPDLEQQISQLEFIERIEKLLEVGTILLIGALLRVEPITQHFGSALLIAGTLIFIIRPIGAWLSTISIKNNNYLHPATRLLFGWFGIRGVGSLYYLSYAFGHGLPEDLAAQLGWITYLTIIISVMLHGVTATPLMKWYERHISERQTGKIDHIEENIE